jgi:hypothetical protein
MAVIDRFKDPKSASDKDLEEILRQSQNTHVAGSLFERAKIELDLRRERRLYELQKKTLEHQNSTLELQTETLTLQKNILETTRSRLDRIIRLLEYIGRKPKSAAVIAALIAVAAGILINVASSLIIKKLPW